VLVVIGLLQAKHFLLLLPTPLQLEPVEPGAVVGQTKALEDQTVATRYFLRLRLLAVAAVARVTCFPQHPLPEVGQMVVQVVALAAARTPQTQLLGQAIPQAQAHHKEIMVVSIQHNQTTLVLVAVAVVLVPLVGTQSRTAHQVRAVTERHPQSQALQPRGLAAAAAVLGTLAVQRAELVVAVRVARLVELAGLELQTPAGALAVVAR
jgi:hypothetical protein